MRQTLVFIIFCFIVFLLIYLKGFLLRAQVLPGAKFTLYPWNPSVAVKYWVIVEIVQLDSELDRDMTFVAQWLGIDLQTMKTVIIKRYVSHQPIIPQNYSGLSKTLSTACALLSNEIVEALATLETQARVKRDALVPKENRIIDY
ncbi:MAG: membrane integrity-associated transporter subunit PqiC [Candidatus Omnitrophica bacterium]|nr:membrane integrity-associated transporter subunit PqiC [Candidatus Omnitrophota bacterium]